MKKSKLLIILSTLTLLLSSCGHQHTFAREWSYDETSHWHAATCEHIEIKGDFGDHKFGDDNVCDVCGYDRTHIHKFSEYWVYDDNNHWHQCSCGEKSDLTRHVFVDGYCECGKIEPDSYVQITINGSPSDARGYRKDDNIYQLDKFNVYELTTISFGYKTFDTFTEYNDVTIKSNEYAVTATNGVIRIPIPGRYSIKFDLTEGVRTGEILSYYNRGNDFVRETLFITINGQYERNDSMHWSRIDLANNFYEIASHDLELVNTIPFEVLICGRDGIEHPLIISSVSCNVANEFVILDDHTGAKYIGEKNSNKYTYYVRFDITTLEPSFYIVKNISE